MGSLGSLGTCHTYWSFGMLREESIIFEEEYSYNLHESADFAESRIQI